MRLLIASTLAAMYYSAGMACIPLTQENLRSACHPIMDSRQEWTSPLVWPITYLSSINLLNRC